MRMRYAWTLCLLALLIAGCAGGSRDEESFEVRPFRPFIGERWIGDAICYGPHRDGQRPGGPDPSREELREDLLLMAQRWNLIRTYGATGPAETILSLIREEGLEMQVLLGVWVASVEHDGDAATAANREEIAEGIRLANAYPDVVAALCVGNETQVDWSPHPSPLQTVIDAVRAVRAGVEQPVTAADDYGWWVLPESRAMAAEVDFVTTHAHPLWNGLQLDDALDWLAATVARVDARHPDRPVILGETGWATSVADHGEQSRLIQGVAGEDEQRRFFASCSAWARDTRRVVFHFEAFDENWKGGDDPVEVEKHWGLYRADRTPKAALID